LRNLKRRFAASQYSDVEDAGVLLIGIQAVVAPRDAIQFFDLIA
jgi:hypothetical protein